MSRRVAAPRTDGNSVLEGVKREDHGWGPETSAGPPSAESAALSGEAGPPWQASPSRAAARAARRAPGADPRAGPKGAGLGRDSDAPDSEQRARGTQGTRSINTSGPHVARRRPPLRAPAPHP
jgi:hypothetical protein